jgi:mannose-6-phosphate isomerase-like protein (cupin superfamily)
MNKFNIYNNLPNNLGNFRDYRGTITDIFYNTNLNHVAIIDSVPFAERGNHYHARSVQHMFIISGSLEYWYRNESMQESKYELCLPGDVITSDKKEVHALRIGDQGCLFMAFTEGLRGGKDYESDTFRVDNIMRST